MRLSDRYKRLGLWSKLAVWGSLCSLMGLLISLWTLFSPSDPVRVLLTTEAGTAEAVANIERAVKVLDDYAKWQASQVGRAGESPNRNQGSEAAAISKMLEHLAADLEYQRGIINFNNERLSEQIAALERLSKSLQSLKATSGNKALEQASDQGRLLRNALQASLEFVQQPDEASISRLFSEIGLKKLTAASISEESKTTFFLPAEIDEFMRRSAAAAKANMPRKARVGTYRESFDMCTSPPSNCIIIEDPAENGLVSQHLKIEAYSGRRNEGAEHALSTGQSYRGYTAGEPPVRTEERLCSIYTRASSAASDSPSATKWDPLRAAMLSNYFARIFRP